ncbi:hypothetical protein THAOC_18520, partial [Thalassiosira oceanica]
KNVWDSEAIWFCGVLCSPPAMHFGFNTVSYLGRYCKAMRAVAHIK